MVNVYFTADTHAWHTNIIKYCNRPFDNADEMTEAIAYNINSKVKKNDVLYHLGDFAFGSPDKTVEFRRMINCRNVILILGNHDHKVKTNPFLYTLFTDVYDGFYEFQSVRGPITVCHYAMRTWNNQNHGAWQLYGHSHGTLPQTKTFSMDVGMDANNLMPLSIYEIEEKLNAINNDSSTER